MALALGPIARAQSPRQIGYETFIELVSKQHPETAINEQRLASAKERIERSGILPDPQVSVGRTDPDVSLEVSISQAFPWPGSLASEEKAATAQTAAIESSLAGDDLERRFAAAELFLRMVRVAKLITVQQANFAVVESVRNFAHTKFTQGVGSHMEYLQAHSESGILKANLAALRVDLKNLKRHAVLLLNDPTLTSPDSLQLDLEWPSKSARNDPNTSDIVRQKLIRSKDVEIARSDVARRRSLPSFMATGMVMQEKESGMQMLGGMIGMSVPLYSAAERRSLSRDSVLAESRIDRQLTWHDRRKVLALEQAQDRIAQIQANATALRKEIIPPVREHMEGATAQFSQGKGDIIAIIDGRRTLLNLQVSEIQTSEALALAILDVEKIHAGMFDMLLDQDTPQLSSPSASMGSRGMAESNGGMTGMPKGAPKAGQRSSRSKPLAPPDMEDQDSSKSSPGMGM